MPRPKRKRIAPIARRRKVAKPAPIARRRKAAPKRRRVTGQFDPLAELIKEFAPAPKRRAAAPIAARPAKKIAHLANDPYATTMFHHGAGAIVPVNRRNPRRHRTSSKHGGYRVIFSAPRGKEIHHTVRLGAGNRFSVEDLRFLAAKSIANKSGMTFEEAHASIRPEQGNPFRDAGGPHEAQELSVNYMDGRRASLTFVVHTDPRSAQFKRQIAIIGAAEAAEHGMFLDFDTAFREIDSVHEEPYTKSRGRSNPRRKKARTNPDAAAAMKLHHETGMSLKEAWQCVQDGGNYDFGSQYEYRKGPYTAGDAMPPVNRRNPKRKKTRTKSRKSEAAAAMELHHNQGISLKQAWARVKRGDY